MDKKQINDQANRPVGGVPLFRGILPTPRPDQSGPTGQELGNSNPVFYKHTWLAIPVLFVLFVVLVAIACKITAQEDFLSVFSWLLLI